jgi:hypothetical protein
VRSLSPATLNALKNSSGERVTLVKIVMQSETLRLTTGSRRLSWGGYTWEAVGGQLEIGPVEVSADERGAGIDVTLSGIDQSIVSLLLQQQYRGRQLWVGRAILDSATGTVLDVVEFFDGIQTDPYEIVETIERGRPGTVTIKTRARPRLAIDEWRGIRTNLTDHQRYAPGDTLFAHVASIAGRPLYWGTPVPKQKIVYWSQR